MLGDEVEESQKTLNELKQEAVRLHEYFDIKYLTFL